MHVSEDFCDDYIIFNEDFDVEGLQSSMSNIEDS